MSTISKNLPLAKLTPQPIASMPSGHRNKPRVFLAYYHRSNTPKDGIYHVSILVRPHPFSQIDRTTLRLHAINKIVKDAEGNASIQWSFETDEVTFASTRLAGVIFLGKLPTGKTYDEVKAACARVPVVNDDSAWRCTNWVIGAIEVRDEMLLTARHC